MIAPLLAKLPAPRAADWGWGVTVCIAVVTRDNSIVAVTDRKVTFSGFSTDHLAIKNQSLCPDWYTLVAGDDIEHAKPILSRAREIIDKVDGKSRHAGVVTGALHAAYIERLHQEIEARELSKRGFTVETFRDRGKSKCSPDVYIDLCSRIDQVRLSLRFLLCGFGLNGAPHIFCVDGKGVPKCYDDVGFWAIGTGGPAALSSLAFHIDHEDFHPLMSEEYEAVYFALAAKFMAESSEMVGESTLALVFRPKDTESGFVPYSRVEDIRKIWKRQGAPKKPRNFLKNCVVHFPKESEGGNEN